MESKINASVSVRDGAVEVSGSEEFVAAQLEKLQPWLNKILNEATGMPMKTPAGKQRAASIPVAPDVVAANNQFENVLAIEDDRVSVLQIPNSSKKSEQAVATALIYLWGKGQVGMLDVPFSEIRQVCRQHGCLDESNFSSHLKAAKTDLIISGGGKSQTARLTIPGQRRALAMIEQLNTPQ
jgi:hypothetical protein